MNSILNLDLLWVGLAVAGAGTLGFSIYFSNTKSATSRAFLFFTSVSILWSVTNFASARVSNPTLALWFIRAVLFFASWHAFSFFLLARQFPSNKAVLSKKFFISLLLWTTFISILVLTPLVFKELIAVSPTVQTKTGPGIALFGLTVFGFVGAGIWSLARKHWRSTGAAKRQSEFVLAGVGITFFFLIVFDFVFPAFLNIPIFVPFGGLFLLPFIVGVAYSILEYELFNPRVAWYGLLTFLLATATFFDILRSDSAGLVLYRVGELVLVLLAGIWLIRSMVREFELEAELQTINAQQVALIHFISHQLKGFIGKARGIFSMLQEGDYGQLPETMKPVVGEGFNSASQGAETIQDILNASNMKSGKMAYSMVPFDFRELVDSIIHTLKPNAEAKGVELTIEEPDEPVMLTGDRMQLENALKNLVDNSIKYTPQGSITATLTNDGKLIRFKTVDTGVGITPEDMKRLFTEGGHGAESQKVNVDSTGFGLYIVKNIIEAHGGKVWAESEGAGKGSTFIVELPVSGQNTGK